MMEFFTKMKRLDQPYVGGWVLMTSALAFSLYVTVLCVMYATTEAEMMDGFATCVYVATVCAVLTWFAIALAGVITAHRMSENRRRLMEALEKIREGDLTARVSFPAYERLEELEHAFNTTMAEIQHRVSRSDHPLG